MSPRARRSEVDREPRFFTDRSFISSRKRASKSPSRSRRRKESRLMASPAKDGSAWSSAFSAGHLAM